MAAFGECGHHFARNAPMTYRRPASEFPNDNLDLHDGALWRCRSVTGASRAVARPRASRSQPEGETGAAVVAAHGLATPPPAAPCESPRDTAEPPTLLSPMVLEAATASSPIESKAEAERPASAAKSATVPPRVSASEAGPRPKLAKAPPTAPAREPSAAFENLLRTLAEVALARGATRAAAVVADLLRTGSVQADLLSRDAIDAGISSGILAERGGRIALSDATYAVARAWRVALEDDGDLANIGHTTLDGFCSELLAVIAADTASTDAIRRELRSRGIAAFGLLEVAA